MRLRRARRSRPPREKIRRGLFIPFPKIKQLIEHG